MKKIVSTFMLASLFAVLPFAPVHAASPVGVDNDLAESELVLLGDYEVFELAEASATALAPCPRGTYRVRKRTSTKKKVVNSLIAGGIGTAIGAGVNGKSGALIGAGTGAGGYLTYRYIRDRKGRCVRSYR